MRSDSKRSALPQLIIALLLGLGLGAIGVLLLPGDGADGPARDAERQPLYWVAPMDANYRRSEPGKSPMGMDLIPVYADGATAAGDSGTVRISPEVVNNLGVRTTRVERGQLRNEIRTVGYVQYDEDRLIHIHPRVEGWIERLYVKAAGDPVAQGQALYALYSPELVNAQEELLLALNRKNSRLVQAAEDRLRALQLPDDLIAGLRQDGAVRQTVTFRSPQAGVIDNLNIREGFFVKPATTLMSIGSLEQVWVEAEIFERQASEVETGLPVTMTLDYLPGHEWQGTVDYVYPSLDEQTRTLRVRLRFPNDDGVLRPNMFAQVVIATGSSENTLIVPREAVIRTGKQDRVVLALGEGRFRSVAVKLGRLDRSQAEILAGLQAGDSIVTSAQFLLDSESSKAADFKRMQIREHTAEQTAEATGRINSVDRGGRTVNISRGAIAKWNRPPATMEFAVDPAVDIATLQEAQRVRFTFMIDDGQFIVTEILGPAETMNGRAEP
jgi:Cu(I)/Ag(I) efflux system membrane fusion protein